MIRFFGIFIVSSILFLSSGATSYLVVIMSTSPQGYVREVGECAASGASFGTKLGGDDSLTGCFVAASPPFACFNVTPPPAPNGSLQCVGGYYAVAARGNCSFAQKAFRAQSAGYKGILIYNFPGSNFPSDMGSDETFSPQVTIPAFMVGYDCGYAIVRSYTYEKYAFLIRVYWSYHDLLRYLVPFVVVVGICFFVMLAAMFVKCVRDRRREMRRRLTKRNLKQIPTKKFVKGEDPETCPICLDDFEENDKLRILGCGHVYHCVCIDPWLLKNRRVCPICKRKVLPGHDDSSDSETDDGAGPSRTSERTPLLSGDAERNGVTVGNSTFYGMFDRSGDAEGNLSPTPPLNRGRAVILSPASTPDVEEQAGHLEESGSREPLLISLEHEFDEGLRAPAVDGHVNPSFVDDTTTDENASQSNSLTINVDDVPKGERV